MKVYVLVKNVGQDLPEVSVFSSLKAARKELDSNSQIYIREVIRKKIKKVFRTEKFIERLVKGESESEAAYLKQEAQKGWPQECEGLTKSEIERIGYVCLDEWLVEE